MPQFTARDNLRRQTANQVIQDEILTARAIMDVCPELSRSEALREAARIVARDNDSILAKYSESMTAAQLCRFVRKHYPAAKADRILARMHNGATIRDALYATENTGVQ